MKTVLETTHWLPLHTGGGELRLNGAKILYIFLFHLLTFKGVLLHDALVDPNGGIKQTHML